MASESNDKPQLRGRPRNVKARQAILRAARELLEEGGLAAVTMEGMAHRAGVGKPTIYRSWPNSHAVAMAAFLESTAPITGVHNSSSAINDLRVQLHKIATVFSTKTGRNVAAMIAAAQSETELAKAFRNHFILESRKEGLRILERAVEQKELRDDLDFDVVLDLIYAPLYFRLLVGHGPLDKKFTDLIIDELLKGLRK
jgi:AcrR family transcriptional regulator